MIHFELIFANGAQEINQSLSEDIWVSNYSRTVIKQTVFFTELTELLLRTRCPRAGLCLGSILFPLLSFHENHALLTLQLCSKPSVSVSSPTLLFFRSVLVFLLQVLCTPREWFNLLINFYKRSLLGFRLGSTKREMTSQQYKDVPPIHRYISPFIWIFFDFSQKCFIVFSIQIFPFFRYILKYFIF